MTEIDAWYLANLACPRDGSPLRQDGAFLESAGGYRYPVVDGVPVMLVDDAPPTMGVALESWRAACSAAAGEGGEDPLFLGTLGISDAERAIAEELYSRRAPSDPIVAVTVGATSGYAYQHLIGRAGEYPIPALRFPTRTAGRLLDIGCNWGRWTIAAARAGHQAIGLDPQLGAVLAAKRVSAQLGAACRFVVGDARFLPFRQSSFDYAWSYSVLQHFSGDDVRASLRELARVVREQGVVRVQMASAFGPRSLMHIFRRGRRGAGEFDVRYRTPSELRAMFSAILGDTKLSADCYFGLGLQWSDINYMNASAKFLTTLSELLRRTSEWLPPLKTFADSVLCTSKVAAS